VSGVGAAVPGEDADRLRALAERLDCVTEDDLCLLAQAKPSTLDAWRKRGKGPSYVLLGNRVLYPRKAVVAYLDTLVRVRGAEVRGVL
jgi:hypothetical protein